MRPSEVARQYIGETEKPNNSGFNDSDFEHKMEQVGFQKGHAWCSYFVEMVFKEAFPARFAEFDKLFSASTIQTFQNAKRIGYQISMIPSVDALVIWQMMKDGRPQSTGHAGIVSEAIDRWRFKSIEGNTSDDKSREGYIVAEHPRKVLLDVTKGLTVLGFIKIIP